MTAPRKLVDQSASINLKVKSQDGREVLFKIRRSTQIKKLLTTYCDRRFLDYRSMRFFINGERFPAGQTPDQLGLTDGDEIEALVFQQGGGYILI